MSNNFLQTVKARRGIYDGLSDNQIDILTKTILQNPYIAQTPFEKQKYCLINNIDELLYGGAAGGGKSSLLLMGALQHVPERKTHSLIIRRTSKQLHKADALIPRAHEWLQDTDAVWREGKLMWTFPNNSTLEFGHMEHEQNKYDYQGSSYDFIGFDELTQFTESQYTYVAYSRSGRTMDVQPRVWCTSNPGGIGHEWVKSRFIEGDTVFIPSLLDENPYLSKEYRDSLGKLDPVTRAQLRDGNWDVMLEGNMFKRDWFTTADNIPIRAVGVRMVRYWDCAGTEYKQGTDPDWTVGLKLLVRDGEYFILDVVRGRWNPAEVEKIQSQTALIDGHSVEIVEEQEPGSSGKAIISHKARHVFIGYSYRGVKSSGSKIDRARPVSAAFSNGLVKLQAGAGWVDEYMHELVAFPEGVHDDQVDATSGAYNHLAIGTANPDRFSSMRTGGLKR